VRQNAAMLAPAFVLVLATMAPAAESPKAGGPGKPPAAAPGAKPGAPATPLAPVTRIEVNHFLELNSFLQVQAAYTGAARPEMAPFVKVYGDHAGSPLSVWHAIHDVCVEATDAAALTAGAKALPSSLKPADREAARVLLEAMAGAWPLYEKTDRAPRQASLENMKRELERRYTRRAEGTVVPELMERFLMKPLDKPLTLYPVNRSTRPGDSGKTARGYYLVQPISGMPVVESMLHELTHLLDQNQPPDQRTLLRRVVAQTSGIPPDTVDAFVHGLIMWNAHELVKRRLGPESAPQYPTSMTPWLAIYEKVWGKYLDGGANADETINHLVEELAATAPAGTSPVAGLR